jgi:hypothetical protein
MKKKIENRGGKREGAGRKKTTEERVNTDIYLSDFILISQLAKAFNIPKIQALQMIIKQHFDLPLDNSKDKV